MATPSKTPATSTPKTATLSPTSVRKMASPRPVTAGKTLSYKSPMAAMKTPASAHSHTSQLSNTPLLQHAFTEGAVNLDSPSAALMGFSNSHGVSPISSGLEALGLPTTATMQAPDGLPRNSEADRVQRLQDVASALKTRVTGRGVTRDGVVRVAQLSGFTTYWDEDLLTVAGNCVDLEIMFDGMQKDQVKDVVLKISAAGSDERQEEASEILKKDLDHIPKSRSAQPWNMLNSFAENIDRLRQLDKLSDSVNCFEAVDGLYDAFKQVWEEEKQRLTWRSELHHLCKGSAGRPRMNKRRKLGVAIDYWVARQELTAPEFGDEDTSVERKTVDIDARAAEESQDPCWTALISCEAGFPSLKVSREWLSSHVLDAGSPMDQPQAHAQELKQLRPAWRSDDLLDGGTSVSKDEDGPMTIDGGTASAQAATDAHFTFTLDPVLYLPLTVVNALVGRGLLISTDEAKVMDYNQVPDPQLSARWLRVLDSYDGEGARKTCKHSYRLFAAGLKCYPVSTVGFAHPRQLSDLLPTFRQHACLWSLLQTLVAGPVPVIEQSPSEEIPYKPGGKIKANSVQKRSNVKLLTPKKQIVGSDALNVDVTLSFSGTAPLIRPKLEVHVPLSQRSVVSKGAFCYASIEIDENGKLTVLTATIPGMDPHKVKASAGRILSLSEDLGVLMEWMIQASARR